MTLQLPEDPGTRFRELYEALNADRGWWEDAASLRFAACSAVTCPGHPNDVAAAIREVAEQIKKESGIFGQLRSSLRFIVATLLVLHEDSARDFTREVARVRELFRSVNLRRGGIYETMACLILRMRSDQAPVEMPQVLRFQALYEEMKRHHWWLTGPNDFPACALLVGRPGEPRDIGNDIEAIYQALDQIGFRGGDPLQTAANILYFSGLEPTDIATRYSQLASGFRDAKVRIWQSDYDELAILTFLTEHSVDTIIEKTLEHRAAVRELRPRPDASVTFNLGASLAFLDLAQHDHNWKRITDTKALLDMQAVINAQAAAAAVAASSAAASAG